MPALISGWITPATLERRTNMPLGLGWPELLIILAVALLLFGGTRLAGVGKGTGRAIREFKEETKGLRDSDASKKAAQVEYERLNNPENTVVDAEVVQDVNHPNYVQDPNYVQGNKQNNLP